MMNTYRTILSLFILIVWTGQSRAADWPHWGGPDANFTVPDAGIIQPDKAQAVRVVWKKTLGSGYSAVTVASGLAVTMYSDGQSDYVIALGAADGATRWRHRIGPAYLGHWGSQSGPLSTPLITPSVVVALSPQGMLFALETATGSRLWSTDLVTEQGGRSPFWGFTSSPRMIDNRIILQSGGSEGMALSAYDPVTGRRLWSAGTDDVDYQSHGVFKIDGEDHILFHGNRNLYGVNPTTGEIRWTFDHEGSASASSRSSHPVEIAEGRYFIKNSGRGGLVVQVSKIETGYVAEKAWETSNLGGTYIYPIYHDGLVFGYKGRILTALDAVTGDRVWRSREPGDGLPLIIDGHLVIITKEGKLSIAPANRSGYTETASLQLFNDIVWSPPAFANGKIYARSMSEIACVELVTKGSEPITKAGELGKIPGTAFANFVTELEAAGNKPEVLNAFLESHPTFPVIERDSLAHFVYIAEAEEVAITGDHLGRRIDQPMHRVAGTNLYYFSSQLEPDARITYAFTVDLQKSRVDPRNPRQIRSLFFGQASWFGMPGWEVPPHLMSNPDGPHGTVETVAFTTAAGDSHKVRVYLPPSYESEQDIAVTYIHDVRRPFSVGRIDTSLDNLIGKSVAPVIVVIVPGLAKGGYNGYVGANRDQYLTAFTEDLIPFIDQRYHTQRKREGRANYGTGRGGFMAFYASTQRPDLFGGMAIQSTYWDQTNEAERDAVIPPADSLPAFRLYLDWGTYDSRSPTEGNDTGLATARFAAALSDKGYVFVGGQINDGAGWASWRNRTHRVFGTLFPVKIE